MMTQIITVGEESGSLNRKSLSDIADTYEADIDEATKLITTVLEPLMILGIGLARGLNCFCHTCCCRFSRWIYWRGKGR